ncbi:hypothetical protein ES703_101258 [subsurface metagenome]
MIAAGSNKVIAIVRYLKFCFRWDGSRFLLSLLNRASITAVPKLKATASPIMSAGSSKMPRG